MEGENNMETVFTSANFDADVLGSEIPVVVDFFATWCGPCRMMAPVIEELAEEYDGKVKIGKLDVDENSDIAASHTFDLHHSDMAEGNVMTEYETKFSAEGKPICKLTACRDKS